MTHNARDARVRERARARERARRRARGSSRLGREVGAERDAEAHVRAQVHRRGRLGELLVLVLLDAVGRLEEADDRRALLVGRAAGAALAVAAGRGRGLRRLVRVAAREPARPQERAHGDADEACLLYTSPSPRDQRGTRMPSSA